MHLAERRRQVVEFRGIMAEPAYAKILEVWDVPAAGKSEEEIPMSGIQARKDFIQEIGLPGDCQSMTQEEMFEVLRECS